WTSAAAWQTPPGAPAAGGASGFSLLFQSFDGNTVTATNDNAGVLNLNSFSLSNFASGTLTIANGTGNSFNLTGTNPFINMGGPNLATFSSTGGNITLAPTTGTTTIGGVGNGNLTFSGAIGGTGGLTINQGGLGVVALNAANTFTGNVILNNGNLALGNATALGNAANTLTVNGGTLRASSAVTVNNNITANSTLVFTGGTDLTLGGIISGNGGLTHTGTKMAAGVPVTLTLTASNTYAGATTLKGATTFA